MRVEVKAIPNAKRDEVILKGNKIEDGLIVRVNAPPDKNKANRALIKLLSRYFNAEVRIIAGERSRKKTIEILQK